MKKILFILIFCMFYTNYFVLAQKDTKLTYRNESGEALEYIYVISYDEGKYAYESAKVKKTAFKIQKHEYPNTQVLLGNESYFIKAGLEKGLSFKNKEGKEKIFAQEYMFLADDKSGDYIVEMGIGIFGYMSGKKGAKLQKMETIEGSAYKNIWQVQFPKRTEIFTISYEKANRVIKCTNKAGKAQTFLLKK
jgi:hypothetical protein